MNYPILKPVKAIFKNWSVPLQLLKNVNNLGLNKLNNVVARQLLNNDQIYRLHISQQAWLV